MTDPVPQAAAKARDGAAPHAVVIGSGFGGLAAAVRLGARGYRVTVLERLDAPGGRAYVYRQDGFTFDAGPTIITMPSLLEELWQLCGRRLADDIELRAMSPFYRIRFDDGATFDTSGDAEAMRRQVARFSPGDVAGYEQFLKVSEETYKIGFEQLAHVPFESVTDMLRIAPDLLRLQGHRSIYSVVSKYVKNDRLRFALSFHPLFVGGNPFTVTAIYSMISFLERRWGVHFVMGGTGRLAEGLVDLIEGQGGKIRYNAEVTSILLDGRRARGVRLASGEEIPADIVVSNADVAWTYSKLLPPEVRRRWSDRRLARSRYSMSLFVWYFGTARQYPDVPHHSILVGPRYRELLEDIFKRKVLAQDFSLYIHRPTATDPSLAPPGCDTFYALSPVPHMESGVDWHERAEPYRRAIAAHLSETILPGLEEQVVSSRMVTPLDFRDRLLSMHGAAFSLEPVLWQSAWFRPHNRSEDVDRLYFVGAGTHPGAGVPGVISSARVLDTVVPDARDHA
ncbi:phytoene desaturase [Thioflavicoccus mobilis 8321]|uniref:Phytoene desaturase (lycopene-forming) n=1 Tax=Thioflavicoccus mobilis 8321 TaxID=765912 RepID=L0GY62_9GAMM|nr:phytoene desaturase [Thioflavicoccus mobilis]AGA91703.1 phytoene desaturase [Thioflavicoccus mobilis 8321]